MKVVFIFLVIVLVAGYMLYTNRPQMFTSQNESTIEVGTHTVRVEHARTLAEQSRGLMSRDHLDDDAGMLFEFPDTSVRSFWNKSTLIPLDVIWIREGKIIGISSLPSEEDGKTVTVSSPEPIDSALEVNAGWASKNFITEGAEVHP